MTKHVVTLNLMVQGVQGRGVWQHQIWRGLVAHLLWLLGSLASTTSWSLVSSTEGSQRQQMLSFSAAPPGPPGWLLVCFPGSGRDKAGREQRGTHVAGIGDPNTCGAKSGEVCRESVTVLLLLVSSGLKAGGLVCGAGPWEPRFLLLWGCYWELLLFFLIPSCFYISQLCQSLGGGKP